MKQAWFAAVACLLIGVGSPANASDFKNGFYFGGAGGAADDKDSCDRIGNPVSPADCSDTDFGWQVMAGWQFVEWVAVEAGITDLGESSYAAPNLSSFSSDVDGYHADVVATVPGLDRFGLYGKVGAFWWDFERIDTDNVGNAVTSTSSSVDLTLGLSLRYPLTESFGLIAEYQKFYEAGRYYNVPEDRVEKNDYTLWTAGFLFRF